MMHCSSIKKAVRSTTTFISRNSSTICSVLALAGLGVSAVCLVKETTEANKLLEDKPEATTIEKVKVVVPAYKKSIAAMTATGLLILGSNCISRKQQASLVGAYTIMGDKYRNYRETVKKEVGEKKELEILKNSLEKYIPYGLDEGKQLYYDAFSSRFFESTPAELNKAEALMNRQMMRFDGFSINELYNELDLKEVPDGDICGWSWPGCADGGWDTFPTFEYKDVPAKDGKPGYKILYFSIEPSVDLYNWDIWNLGSDAEIYMTSLDDPDLKRILTAMNFDFEKAKKDYEKWMQAEKKAYKNYKVIEDGSQE